jgi:hypothetical protein
MKNDMTEKRSETMASRQKVFHLPGDAPLPQLNREPQA